MTVNENYEDQYGRSCIVFSGVRKFSEVYDWLFAHYSGYKFAVLLDCSKDELPDPDNKIYVNFLADLHEEVAMETGYVRKDNSYVRR
ncbi:MAG: hypothetical protein IJ779_03505 [Ruminococcus sp.]|nr:hypothetical protein [Ruminococcus sp.]